MFSAQWLRWWWWNEYARQTGIFFGSMTSTHQHLTFVYYENNQKPKKVQNKTTSKREHFFFKKTLWYYAIKWVSESYLSAFDVFVALLVHFVSFVFPFPSFSLVLWCIDVSTIIARRKKWSTLTSSHDRFDNNRIYWNLMLKISSEANTKRKKIVYLFSRLVHAQNTYGNKHKII